MPHSAIKLKSGLAPRLVPEASPEAKNTSLGPNARLHLLGTAHITVKLRVARIRIVRLPS